MKQESDEEFLARIKREVELMKDDRRCGECQLIYYDREYEQYQCMGGYCNPSDRACVKFKEAEGKPIEGTWPSGEMPQRVRDKEDAAYLALSEKKRKSEDKPQKVVTNYEALMSSFKVEDNLIDYLQRSSCEDCEHENGCPHAYKGDWKACREFLRKWLHEPYK